jgi:hypothetical protein
MKTQLFNYNSGDQLSARPFLTRRTVQPAVWPELNFRNFLSSPDIPPE